jgi:hypothetical protein
MIDWTQEQINSAIFASQKEVCAKLAMMHNKLGIHNDEDAKTLEHAISLIAHLFKHSEYAAYYTEKIDE